MAEVKEKATEKVEEKKTAPKKVTAKVTAEKAEKAVAPKAKAKTIQFCGTGRRKKSIARVRLIPGGNGDIIINGKPMDEYFDLETLKLIVCQPLELTGSRTKYNVVVNVIGGGYSGQAGAISHGISRALVEAEENLKPELKKAGFITRDSRMKERKKFGLKKARKAPQFSKR